MKPGVPLLDDTRFNAAVQAVYRERAAFEFPLVATVLHVFRNAYCATPPNAADKGAFPQTPHSLPDGSDTGDVATPPDPNREYPLPPN